ncbi:MAG: YlxR family protein [Proteobacteria bacterium]|nr:YlxR family protein [Pseudomonadota bacterium]
MPTSIRTCVACRATREKSELVRMVAVEGHAVIDEQSSMKGRGAYICRRAECVEVVAQNKGRLSRAFRKETEAPDADLFRKRLGLFKSSKQS